MRHQSGVAGYFSLLGAGKTWKSDAAETKALHCFTHLSWNSVVCLLALTSWKQSEFVPRSFSTSRLVVDFRQMERSELDSSSAPYLMVDFIASNNGPVL